MGDANIVLAGGTENMSLIPHVIRGIRFGVKLGTDVSVSKAKLKLHKVGNTAEK